MAAKIDIEPFRASMMDAVVRLSLRAWEPVFASMEAGLDPDVFRALYPDWRVSQAAAVTATCSDPEIEVWVARADARVVGFVATKIHDDGVLGEVYMIAVDPDSQRRRVATRLTEHALDRLRARHVKVAMVETGGDPGHEPARSLYESTGFRLFPISRYFRSI